MLLKRRIFWLLVAAFFSMIVVEAQEKHLFILSGQSNMAALNPSKSFTPTVSEAFGAENVIVVKYAIGGKPIRCWFDNWKTLVKENPKQNLPNIYHPLVDMVKKAIKNESVASVTFLWMQGERDAREKRGDEYQKNLLRVYSQLSRDINREDINMVIGRLSDHDMQNQKFPHWTKLREIQVNLANSNPRFSWIDTDDLNEGINFRGNAIKNDLHMSVEGYKVMGKRFAEKAIALIER